MHTSPRSAPAPQRHQIPHQRSCAVDPRPAPRATPPLTPSPRPLWRLLDKRHPSSCQAAPPAKPHAHETAAAPPLVGVDAQHAAYHRGQRHLRRASPLASFPPHSSLTPIHQCAVAWPPMRLHAPAQGQLATAQLLPAAHSVRSSILVPHSFQGHCMPRPQLPIADVCVYLYIADPFLEARAGLSGKRLCNLSPGHAISPLGTQPGGVWRSRWHCAAHRRGCRAWRVAWEPTRHAALYKFHNLRRHTCVPGPG